MGVRRDHGWLSITLNYQGKRQVIYLGLKDNRDNYVRARKIDRDIQSELLAGAFNPEKRELTRKLVSVAATQRRAADELTLGALVERWLDEWRAEVEDDTMVGYRSLMGRHVLQHPIATMRLVDVTDEHLRAWVGDMKAKLKRNGEPISKRTINMTLDRLRTAFSIAYDRDLIPRDPMRKIKRVDQGKSQIDPMRLDEVRALLDASKGWFRSYLVLLVFGGLRPNEALALTWGDIDWEHGVIIVRSTLNRRAARSERVKTLASNRDVEMMSIVRRALQEQRERSGDAKSGLVFPSADDTPRSLNNIRKREWPTALQAAGLKPRVLYQCRHTCAALCLEYGDTPQHVAAQLGHTNIEMVIKVYSRWTRRPQSDALARLDDCVRSANIEHKVYLVSTRSNTETSVIPINPSNSMEIVKGSQS